MIGKPLWFMVKWFFDERSGGAERKVNYVDFCHDSTKHKQAYIVLTAPKVQG